MICYVEKNMLARTEVQLLTDVTNHYQALICEIGGSDCKETVPTAQKLEVNILKKFGERIRIEKGQTK